MGTIMLPLIGSAENMGAIISKNMVNKTTFSTCCLLMVSIMLEKFQKLKHINISSIHIPTTKTFYTLEEAVIAVLYIAISYLHYVVEPLECQYPTCECLDKFSLNTI